MKRYELDAFDTITEKPDGYLVYYDDVLKETIPRPAPQDVPQDVERLVEALKLAYRKHHLGDDSVGWDELSEKLMDALCFALGEDGFAKWRKLEVKP